MTGKERSILFSGPMVAAILAGRKSETRRIVRPQPLGLPEHAVGYALVPEGSWPAELHVLGAGGKYIGRSDAKPYAMPGDRLWVRETWREVGELSECTGPDDVIYRATASEEDLAMTTRWRPSIFMPRWASRLTLDVVSVRAERLQAIDASGVLAEGLCKVSKDSGQTWRYGQADSDGWPGSDDHGWPWSAWERDPLAAFAKGWDGINGARAPWSSNPWVWVIAFDRVDADGG